MEQEEKSTFQWKICSSFVLKIIAFLTMTLDHVGVMMQSYGLEGTTYDIFRIIGRIAMPLFCFMIVEGVIHTKSFKKYILRLSLMAVIISIALTLLYFIPQLGFKSAASFGNIFLDLALGATAIYCLRLKGTKKLFALLPFIYVCLSFAASKYEANNGAMVWWLPFFMRTQYDFMSFFFIVIFYLAYFISDQFFKIHAKQIGAPEDTFKGSEMERTSINLISGLLFFSVVLLFHFFFQYLTVYYMDVQIYALFAGAFILLYNGKRGYNSKWFEYGGYLYYPAHILIIALVFYLIHL